MKREKEQRRPRYVADPEPDIDLDKDDVRDAKGVRVDQAYVQEAVADVRQHLRMGRPRRDEQHDGEAPRVVVRLPHALHAAVTSRAQREGRPLSAIVREAVEEYLVRADG